jgi:hypothetical protein
LKSKKFPHPIEPPVFRETAALSLRRGEESLTLKRIIERG